MIPTWGTTTGVNAVLNSADLYLPLTHSLVAYKAAASAPPTFTRATTATVMGYGPTANSGDAQTLLTVASGEARFSGARRISQDNWSDTFADGTPIPSSTLKGYLAEGAATNLCLQSNAFTTTWTAVGSPSATQNVVGPDGATSAWTFTDNDAAANSEGVFQNITLTAAAYTFSVFVKKTVGAQTSYPVLYTITGTNIALATIDTSNGIATPWTAYTGLTIIPASARCSSFNDDYWRVEVTYTGTAAAYGHYILAAATANATQSTGAISVALTGSAVFYGAQVELGSSATSYIPTTTGAVARNADVLTYPSAGNVSGTVGWCYAEAGNTPNTAAIRQPIISTYSSGNGLILNTFSSASPATVEFYDGSAFRTGQTYTQSIAPQKFAASWGTGVKTAVGGSVTAQLTFDGDAAAGTAIGVGIYTDGSGTPWNGTIRNVRIGQRQLSSSELQAITR